MSHRNDLRNFSAQKLAATCRYVGLIRTNGPVIASAKQPFKLNRRYMFFLTL
jgi:hypothetical protein